MTERQLKPEPDEQPPQQAQSSESANELFSEAMRMPRKRPPEEGEDMPKAKFQAVEDRGDEGAIGGASSSKGPEETGEIHYILKQLC